MTVVKPFFVIITLSLIIFSTNLVTSLAQTVPIIYICVAPNDADREPYLIEFWDSEIFGVMIPEDASLRFFSNTFYVGSLHTINTNANTGGYLTMEDLSRFRTYTIIPAENPCLNADTEALFDSLPLQTIPIPISSNHAVVLQARGANLLNNPFQRVISFTFDIDQEDTDYRNLQIIQNSDLDPFINFRYSDLEQNTPFMVISNKDFGIGQSLPDTNPPEFSRERPSDIRSFVKSDLQDLYGLDIFEFAKQSQANIFIHGGLLDTYRGNYIRISLAPDPALRIPEFSEGVTIKALPDATATFIATNQVEGNRLLLDLPFDTNPLGQLVGDSVYRVIEVDDLTGQLIIDFDGNEAIVESWLVEAVATTGE